MKAWMSERDWIRALLLTFGAALVGSAARYRGDLGDLMPGVAAAALLVIGVGLLVAWRLSGPDAAESDPGGRVELIPLIAVALAVLLLAARVELAVAAGALAGAGALAWSGRGRALLIAASTAAVAVAVALGVWALVDRLALARTEFPFVGNAVGTLLGLLGGEAAAGGGDAIHWTVRASRPVSATTNAVGLGIQATAVSVIVLLGLSRGVRLARMLPVAAFGLVLALGVRFALLTSSGAAADGFMEYSDVNYSIAGFLDWRWGLPIDLIAALALLPAARLAASQRPAAPGVGPAWVPALGALAGLLLGFDSLADALSSQRPIRVAIDEGHSRWEPSDLKLGEDDYGQETGYNFRALADWLAGRYGPVRRLYDPLDAHTLADIDVLILKTPTELLTASEVESLVGFVERGGGLALIGDHTNVFGTSDVLAPLARRFGFEYEFDCLFDQRQRFEQVLRPREFEQRHPVLASVDLIRFEVGCSIKVLEPWRVRPVAVGRGMKSQLIDYAASNFYPMIRDDSDMHYGQFADVVTSRAGRGRVVGLADSTFLSSFSVCMPGRRELVEGIVDWLGREDRVHTAGRPPFLLAVLVAVALALVVARRGEIALGAGALALCGALAWTDSVAAARQIDSERPNLVPEVHFLESNSGGVKWPITQMVREEASSFHLFFQWVLRTGRFPRLIPGLDGDLDPKVPLVWVDPPALTGADRKALEAYLEVGGTVIAMDLDSSPGIAAIAELAGLGLAEDSVNADQIVAVESNRGLIELGRAKRGWRRVVGGEPLLRGRGLDGAIAGTLAAMAPVGQGSVVVISCAELFNDVGFGLRYDIVPDDDRRRLFQFQFDLLRAIHAPGGARETASRAVEQDGGAS